MGLYCGIDLHSNNHMLMVIDDADRRVYERRLPNDLAITKAALEPYRADLVAVAVDMAITTVLPFPTQRMIDVLCRQRSIGREKR
jgi:hypothetical protein